MSMPYRYPSFGATASSRLPLLVRSSAGVFDTSQSCQSPEVSWKWRLYAPVFASSTTTEPEYKFAPFRGAVAKSGAEFPAGTYSSPLAASNVNDVHVAPPVTGVPG